MGQGVGIKTGDTFLKYLPSALNSGAKYYQILLYHGLSLLPSSIPCPAFIKINSELRVWCNQPSRIPNPLWIAS